MRTQPNDGLPPVNDYERATFFQLLQKRVKPVFGQGRTVTKADVAAAFFQVNPDYDEGELAQAMFDMMVWPALELEVQTEGFVIVEATS